jgi:hypothetical protein
LAAPTVKEGAAMSYRTPWDENNGVTLLQEKVLELLEAAGIPGPVCDKIIDLIADAERRIAHEGEE